jgi:Tfp pilus assembly protein PilO
MRAAMRVNFSGMKLADPRVGMRALLGVLLIANLVVAVIAFKPFGGSADDLRRDRNRLQQQLAQLQAQVSKSKKLVDKVQTARSEGDQFLSRYFTDSRVVTSTIQGELMDIAKAAGITYTPVTMTPETIEGSDTLGMITINAGCQGTYAALAKFVNMVDRSARFLIIESMVATPTAQQTGQLLSVTLKIDTFVQDMGPGSAPALSAAADTDEGAAGAGQ